MYGEQYGEYAYRCLGLKGWIKLILTQIAVLQALDSHWG